MSTELQAPSARAAIEEAVKRFGGPTALAAVIGVSRPAVSQWRQCPALRVLQIEALTGVPRHVLRPDLYPPEA